MTIRNERNANDWGRNSWNCWHGDNYCAGSQGWGRNPGPTDKKKGSVAKGESPNPVGGGREPRIDHGGNVYKYSDWDLKTNDRNITSYQHASTK